jgi:Cellulase (glycosyl hydrolase family 5)
VDVRSEQREHRRTLLKAFACIGTQLLLPKGLAASSIIESQQTAPTSPTREQMDTTAKQPRGRVRVGKGTVLTDDGSLLRMVHSYVHDYFHPCYTDPLWWRAMREVGHFNTVRVMAFLGSWPKSTQVMDLKTLLPRLDGMVDLAAQAGLYLLIDNHSECCGNQDVPNDTAFWEAVAPRYKDRTHVFYELKNEPWQYSGLAEYERTMYRLVRPLAPDTHIILWTIENLIDLTDPLAMIRSLPEVSYGNASVGFHPYQTFRTRQKLCDALGLSSLGCEPRMQQLLKLIETMKSSYPTIMTEFSPNAAGAPGHDFLMTMEKMGISWSYLGSQGFTDAGTGKTYGMSADQITILWPKD